MTEFKRNENFQPTQSTLRWWLYTEKLKASIQGVGLPGLFSTTNYGWKLTGFFMIFLLEGVATYWSMFLGVIITAIITMLSGMVSG